MFGNIPSMIPKYLPVGEIDKNITGKIFTMEIYFLVIAYIIYKYLSNRQYSTTKKIN